MGKLEERCTELEQQLTRANEENKRIQREKEIIVESSKQLQFHCQEKEQVVQELNKALLKSRIEFRAAQEQMQGDLISLQQQVTDLRDLSEGKGKKIQQLSDQIDTDKKKLSELEEELTVVREQNTIFLSRVVKEVKGVKQVIAQLQSEIHNNLSKSGKKSLDELRRSYEELKVQTEEERAITERQVRAYKKQVDELSERLAEANDKVKKMQERCDKLVKVETERNELKAKLVSELEEELTVAREQNKIFQEEITRSVGKEKGARQVIAQLQSEIDKNKQVLSKSEKKSLDELRRSYEELKVQTEEERAITERQVRAYKKQVDQLSEKLSEANDKTKRLQDRCDELVKVETERKELIAKVHTLKENEEKLNDMLHGKIIRESELEEKLEKMKAGNKVLKKKKDTFEKELEEANKACTLYQTQLATEKANHHETHSIMTQEMDKMRNAIIVLQQRMREAWLQVDKLQDEILSLKTNRPNLPPPTQSHSQSPYGFTPDDGRSRHNDPQAYQTDKTREADLALLEAEVTIQQLEATRRTGRGRHPVNLQEDVETRKNPVIEDIDREIHDVAEDIRMTRPPPTQEIQQDDGNSDIPYDPNLTCPGCGQRYRFGEIQKLRRHFNETCSACDKYTCTIQEQNKMERDQKDDMLDTMELAKLIRRENQAPCTDEVINPEDNSDIPYDPNLTCPGCGQRYRIGEIQKLRRHVNEFCPARDKYTQQF